MKLVKQRFKQWYNRTHGRKGTLWEERYKSVLWTVREKPLRRWPLTSTSNPVRAGLVDDPKISLVRYAEAVAGGQKP